jgi:hypothetical protein
VALQGNLKVSFHLRIVVVVAAAVYSVLILVSWIYLFLQLVCVCFVPGIIPRAVNDMFNAINETASAQPDTMFLVKMSYVELYNNQFRNLIDWSMVENSSHHQMEEASSSLTGNSQGFFKSTSDKIEVRENSVAGVHLVGPGLRAPVTNARNVLALINAGNKLRSTAATNCNSQSSRSHAILTLYVESRRGVSTTSTTSASNSGKGTPTMTTTSSSEVRMGKLHMVDLAGSERVSLSGAEGDTLLEAQNINLSLSTLGDVLSALSHNATMHNNHLNSSNASSMVSAAPTPRPVPYRNSKLTVSGLLLDFI